MSRAYVHHIVEYLEHEKDPPVREPSTVDLSNALKFLDSEGANALRAHGLQLHKATLREGELMYTPPGMYTLRRRDRIGRCEQHGFDHTLTAICGSPVHGPKR